jgi:hypothetical protein
MVVAITSRTQFTYADVIAGARGFYMDKKMSPDPAGVRMLDTPVDEVEDVPVAHIKLMRLC